MAKAKRIGMIGLDTSHIEVFAKILNNPDDPNHIPGWRIAAGWPGGSPDFDLSISRVNQYTNLLKDDCGTAILETPEAVAEQSDLIFILTIDGRIHLDLFKRIVSYGKPVFIDKPLTASLADAEEILRLAGVHNVLVMSCSSLRYADNLQAALADEKSQSAVTGCDVFGPMEVRDPLPGLYWYGVHSVEILVTVMGVGCCRVNVVKNDDNDAVVCEWQDGRVGIIRGVRKSHKKFGVTLHRVSGFQALDLQSNDRPYYASLLEAILGNLPEGRSPISNEQMLEVIRIIDAANESRESGRPVELSPARQDVGHE